MCFEPKNGIKNGFYLPVFSAQKNKDFGEKCHFTITIFKIKTKNAKNWILLVVLNQTKVLFSKRGRFISILKNGYYRGYLRTNAKKAFFSSTKHDLAL